MFCGGQLAYSRHRFVPVSNTLVFGAFRQTSSTVDTTTIDVGATNSTTSLVLTGNSGGLISGGRCAARNAPTTPRFTGESSGDGHPPTLATAVALMSAMTGATSSRFHLANGSDAKNRNTLVP